MPRVSFDDFHAELRRVLLSLGFSEARADACARLFAETSRDGVYSHGLNRFPRFVEQIRRGVVDVEAEPERVGAFGAIEQWDGRRGPGNLNAWACMDRAIALARDHGLGCVGLRNTNHWMRGGSYGWQAAQAGLIGMCWTNTMPNLPPWGAREARVGNNPMIVAVPRPGAPVVLDMAVSQFSYGALASYRRRGEPLPVDGGFDRQGRLTRDAAEIEATQRPLPIGCWKGSGLALLLDLTAALLAGGRATHQITPDPIGESDLSQVFLAFDLPRLYGDDGAAQVVDGVLDYLHGAEPAAEDGAAGDGVYYPGERTLRTRRENEEKGIPVDPEIWARVQAM